MCIGVDFVGLPGHAPPIFENRPCIYQFLPHSAPPNFGFAPPIFLTRLRQCQCAMQEPHNSIKFYFFKFYPFYVKVKVLGHSTTVGHRTTLDRRTALGSLRHTCRAHLC